MHDRKVDAVNYNEHTALHIACFLNNTKIISLLTQKGANASIENNSSFTLFTLMDFTKLNDEQCLSIMVQEFSKLTFEKLLASKQNVYSIYVNQKL